MNKKSIKNNKIAVTNWYQVDDLIKSIGEIEIFAILQNAKATLQINTIKESVKNSLKDKFLKKKELEQQVLEFCESRKSEFAKKRSKELIFGSVGFRVVTSVAIPKNKDKIKTLIDNFKAFGLGEFIVFEEKINREKVLELNDSDIAKLGLKRVTKDSFRIVPEIEKIKKDI